MADVLMPPSTPTSPSMSSVASPPLVEPALDEPAPTVRTPREVGRWRGAMVAVAMAGSAATLSGWWTPRGPVSSAQALSAMALGLAVGLVAGTAWHSRWAIVLPPAVFALVFELVRIDAVGPTVDAPRVDLAGLLTLAAGRLVHGVLVLVPMMLGATYALAWWRRRYALPEPATTRRAAASRRFRRAATGVLTVSMVLLAMVLVRPATTDPILGADGDPLPGSIAELTRLRIGGHDQAVLIRGNDARNPILLFLAGGPGGFEMGVMSRYGHLLEQDFVVVTWDQRGTGRSYGSFEPVETLTFDQAVADTIELTEYLLDRFGDEQLYVVGESYGTLLGAHAVQQRPDLYAAFIGSGQMVSTVATDRMFHQDAIAYAERVGDEALLATMESLGEPPYADPLDYLSLVSSEQLWNDYSDVEGHESKREPTGSLGVPEYTLMDQIRALTGLADTYAVLYPQLDDVDLRSDVPALEVPVYIAMGRYEARGRVEPAREWFDLLAAPEKEMVTFEVSGHRAFVEEPEAFHSLMTNVVLAETWDGPLPGAGTVATPRPADDELIELFQRYNPAVWPGHLVAYALALIALWRVIRRPGPTTDRIVTGLLATMWLWLGVVFFGRYAAQFDPLLSAAYGTLFVVQAGLFVRAGLVGDRLRFVTANGAAGRLGWLALGYAVLIYPLLGMVLGHGYPEAPLLGMAPCPSTIATLGLLLLVRPPLPRHLLAIPFIWAILAPLAAVARGVPEDLGLLVVGVATVLVVVIRDRPTERLAHHDRSRIDA